MKIFGFNLSFTKRAPDSLNTIDGGWRNGWRLIIEPFAGAFQQNIDEKVGDLTTYPTLYACIYRISSDIGKLPFRLRQRDEAGSAKAIR